MHTSLEAAREDLLPVDAPPAAKPSTGSRDWQHPTYEQQPFSFLSLREELEAWLPDVRGLDRSVSTSARLNDNISVTVIYVTGADTVRLSVSHDGAHNTLGQYRQRTEDAAAALSTMFALPNDWEPSTGHKAALVLTCPATDLLSTDRS